MLKMIRASQLTVKHESSHQKFDTIRKTRTLYSNLYESSSRASNHMYTFRGSKGDIMTLSNCSTQSRFFSRFSNGLLERMGKQVKSDLALDHMILKIIIRNLNTEFEDQSVSSDRKRWLIVSGTYLVVRLLCSLRGNVVTRFLWLN